MSVGRQIVRLAAVVLLIIGAIFLYAASHNDSMSIGVLFFIFGFMAYSVSVNSKIDSLEKRIKELEGSLLNTPQNNTEDKEIN